MILSPAQWVKGSGIATAVAKVTAGVHIHSLTWELPYAVGVAIKNDTIKCKMVQSLTKTNKGSLQLHEKFKMGLPYDPAISTSSKGIAQRDICTAMFIALFIRAKRKDKSVHQRIKG